MSDQEAKKIVVIGGGPAGVFAAIEAKRADAAAAWSCSYRRSLRAL